MSLINTGNDTVNALGEMNFSGNVIPMNWFKTIRRENGRPYLVAINILSEICYWYRPVEKRNEATGMVEGYFTKFKEDLLQKSYEQLSEQFGESKRVIKEAVIFLEKLGVIERVFRNKKVGGTVLANVMYIRLDVDALKHLTFDEPVDESSVQVGQKNFEQEITQSAEGTFTSDPHTGNVYRSDAESYRGVTKNCIDPYTEKRDTSAQPLYTGVSGDSLYPRPGNDQTPDAEMYRGVSENRQTYTENTTKITKDITSDITQNITKDITSNHQEPICEGERAWEYVRLNIRLDERVNDKTNPDRELYAELGGYIEKFFLSRTGIVRVNRENKPYAVVESVFMKLTDKAIDKVIRDYHGFEGTIERREPFFLTALYNAVVAPDMVRTGKSREESPGEKHNESRIYSQLERLLASEIRS